MFSGKSRYYLSEGESLSEFGGRQYVSTREHAVRPPFNQSIDVEGGSMPRINVDDELRADPRFHSLCNLVKRHEAFGALLCLWETGQSFWKRQKALIPKHIFDLLPFGSDLLRCGFAEVRDEGIYCTGADERWAFLLERSEAGKIGGRSSAEARRIKYGSAIPFNASNSEANAERNSEANRNKPNPSSSSSSSNNKKTLDQTAFDRFWVEYPRKVGKGKARDSWIKKSPPLESCLKTLSWQKGCEDWKKDGGQFIPHPATWINQERWNDEPKISPSAPPPKPKTPSELEWERRYEERQARLREGKA